MRRRGPSGELDGDVAIVFEIARTVHDGHAALSELAFDAVAVGERSDQAGSVIAHTPKWRLGRWSASSPYVNTDSAVRAPTLSLGVRHRLSLITRRLWTDIMISDFRLGVEGFATSALKSFPLEERMTPNA